MRLKEFIKEEGGKAGSEFDTPANTKPAETPDWLKNAGKWLGNKIGLKEPVSLAPGALPPVEPKKSTYTGIDPIQRQRLGLPPATHDEIDAYFKKPENSPFIKGVTGGDGRPVMSGSALELERAAREAAPREFYPPLEKAAAAPPAPAAGMSDAEIAANAQRIKTPREQGNYLNKEFDDRSFDRSPVAPGGSEAPKTKVDAPSSATVQGGAAGADSRLSKVPPVAVAQPISTTTIKTEPIAAVGGENSEQDDAALAKLKKDEGLGDTVAAEPPVAVKDPLAAVDSGSLGRPANAGVAAGAPASTSDPEEFIRDKSDDKFDRPEKKKTQNPEPDVKKPDAPAINPDAQKKRQTSGARKAWGTVKDKDGRQVYIDGDGGKWVWPANGSSWQPANMVPGSDYVDKKLPTTTGYTPAQNSEPLPTSNPLYNRFKTVDAVDAEIKRFKDKYDMSLSANQKYIQNLMNRKSELVGRNVNESSGLQRMKFLAGLIKD